MRVALAAARLVALGGEAALELGDDAVDGGEVLQRPGGQRAVELGQRPRRRERLGALDLRALELAPQVRLEAADLVARQSQLLARDVLLHRATGLGAQAERAADPLDVDPEHAGPLAAAPERGDREPREVAHRGVVAVADRLQELLAQVVELDPLTAGDAVLLIALADLVAQRLGLGGAEEEALEHEVEDAPVLGRLGERGGEGGAEVARGRPRHRLERGERVVELGRPDRHPLGAQRLSELEDPGVEAHAVAPSRTPTRSATVSRSVRCLTMIDIVSRNTSWSMSSAPSSSSARAQSIDSAIEGGFLRSSSRTWWMT